MPKDVVKKSSSSKLQPYPTRAGDGDGESTRELKAFTEQLEASLGSLAMYHTKTLVKRLDRKLADLEVDVEQYKTTAARLEEQNQTLREQLAVANQAATDLRLMFLGAKQQQAASAAGSSPASARSMASSSTSVETSPSVAKSKAILSPATTSQSFWIHVRTTSGDTTPLETHKYETVDVVKAKVFIKQGIPPHQARLYLCRNAP